MRNFIGSLLLGNALIFLLSACGTSSPSRDSANSETPTPPSSTPTNRFAAAKGCLAFESVATGGFAIASDGGYSAIATETNTAEAFFFQPATLGKYLFYAQDRRFIAIDGNNVIAATEPSDNAIWTVDLDESTGNFFLVPDANDGTFLSVTSAGDFVLSNVQTANTAFKFAPTDKTCTEYPEMPIGTVGDTYKGNGVDQPIIGFADVHTHQGMSSEMSYAGDVGPSAGGVLYGEVFHRFGVEHALHDCEEFHGPDGATDANNILEATPGATHDTQGWPTFVDWPRRNFLTHQVMYYRWVERAWMSGLRLIVNHGTNIAALCRLGKQYSGRDDADCDDMGVGVKQLEYLYEVQDYIDAQHGGPGEGWFRIVLSPQEAREVINDGKLAVVLGLEFSQMFGCGVDLTGETEANAVGTPRCDEAQVQSELDRVWDLGVRHIYVFHDIDSALGGAGIFSADVLNYLNFLDTNRFWKTTDCRDYPEDEPSQRTPGAAQSTSLPFDPNDTIAADFFAPAEGQVPVYPPGPRCNARTVTDLGEFTINAMMDKRMVIDIDHSAYHSKDIMLDIADQRTPPYPFASTHDAHGGLTSDQAQRLLANGGIIYPYKGNGIRHKQHIENLKFWRDKIGAQADQYLLAAGYGADGNGFGGHPGPRGGDSELVQYPFTLFEGPDWGPQFNNIAPVTFDLLTIPESGKFWNIDEVGMAHYGMVADFVEEVRIESGREGLDVLFNSAEAYVQMWELSYNRD